jgi:hypothetical protein
VWIDRDLVRPRERLNRVRSAVTVRLHGNAEDERRGFNRTENVRPIAPGDNDFARLYAIGHARQHVNLLGFAVCVNSVALHEHRRRREQATAA